MVPNANVNIDTHTVTIDGNLVVTGTQTTVESTDTALTDNTIILNAGETGAGVTAGIQVLKLKEVRRIMRLCFIMKQMIPFELKIGSTFPKLEVQL